MNLLTIRAQARKKSGVNVADYSNSLLDADANQAYYTLAGILANMDEDFFEEQNVKFDLQLNSSLYSLPTDFIAMKQVRLAYTTPTSPSDYKIATTYGPEDIHTVSIDEENIPTSNPIYDITNNYVRLKPKPTSQVTNGGLLYYIAMPSALTNTGDVPILPLQYHDLLAIYCAKEMTFKYEKWQKHTRLESDWNNKIGELQLVLAERDRNDPLRFKAPQEIGGFNRQLPRELA